MFSRLSFMSHFTGLVGGSRMTIMREMRMRGAAQQLKATNLPVNQVARNMGMPVASVSCRLFGKTWGQRRGGLSHKSDGTGRCVKDADHAAGGDC